MLFIKRFGIFCYRCYYRLKNNKLKLFEKTKILPGSSFGGYNSIGANSVYYGSMGHDTYIGSDCFIYANIGNYSSIGDRVNCIFASHPTSQFVSTSPVFYSLNKQTGRTFVNKQLYKEVLIEDDTSVPVSIGNDVWIGSNVLIIGSVKIADGSVVAAGSVVTHDTEPYSIVAGVPAKVMRFRHTNEQIDSLLSIKWWEKDEKWIINNAHMFSNVENFVEQFGEE